jgi:thioredoxin reductase (NADPH)
MEELIIVGGGVAGMTASIYASRYQIKHLLLAEKQGGQGMLAGTVENYPGYLAIPGPELMQKILEQVKKYGVEMKEEKVGALTKIDNGFEVKTGKTAYQAQTLILAMGASFRSLNIPSEDRFIGKGISYCTTCDIPLFKGKTVAIVGGGDSAVSGALHATKFAKKVFIIHRREEFRAEPARVKKMRETKKVEEVLENEVQEIKGTEKVTGLVLKKPYQSKQELTVDGVFIEIGQVPTSSLVKPLGVSLDGGGYIKVNPEMATNVAGIYAAGDIAAIQGGLLFRQFITAAADGARAASSVYRFLHQGAIPAPSWGQKS